ncbi:MAG: M15 family metallopeptidase [Succinivibrio sp.]|nr:M15 family metallopeptidase [Succinivibrio sp.]
MFSAILGIFGTLSHLLTMLPVLSFLLTAGFCSLSVDSLQKLAAADLRLQLTVLAAAPLTPYDVEVAETVRSRARQLRLLREGHSLTLNSAHLTGRAVDLMLLKPDRTYDNDFDHYQNLSLMMKTMATLLGVDLIWGGDWPKFKDGPHFQLKPEK